MYKDKKKLFNIDVSLSRGILYGNKQFVVGGIAIASSVLLIILGIASLILTCLEWDAQIFFCAIASALIGITFLVVMIYCLIKDKKNKKDVSLWIEDAIKVHGIAEKIDAFRPGFQPICYKIRVKFYIGETSYMRESTTKGLFGMKGFNNVFKKYADKSVELLYSPTYDEVLILKN